MPPDAITAFSLAPGLHVRCAFPLGTQSLGAYAVPCSRAFCAAGGKRRSAKYNVSAVDTLPSGTQVAENDAVQPLVPVTILTGFLGSGKTTLLNNILNDTSHGMKFAVIENEFGDVGVDDKVLSENVAEEVIEVMNGCICCTVRGDLVTALERLYERVNNFDGVIIETTGIADPSPVCQTFFLDDNVADKYCLDSVITVVDSKYILERFEEEREAVTQVVYADKVLVNKIDLVDERKLQTVEAKLRAINPTASVQRTQHAKVKPAEMLNIQAFQLDRVLDMNPNFLHADGEDAHGHEHDHDHEHELEHDHRHDHEHDYEHEKDHEKEHAHAPSHAHANNHEHEHDHNHNHNHNHNHEHDHKHEHVHAHDHNHSVTSISVKVDGEVNMKMLENWINRLVIDDGANLYRYKGVIAVKGIDWKYVFQGVGMLFQGDFSERYWKEGERRESCFVFIGKKLDHDFYTKGFKACQEKNQLRFPVGSLVRAKVDDFHIGKVIKHWERGNAYLVELDNEEKSTVYVPVDIDEYILAA